ncbi:VOC family protein [Bordetella trematum]|uniref:VOC family protein n=1 Tax=Bordetella trematum TaxID=123899 RepID=UPI0039894205
MTICDLHHVHLFATDLDASLAFYQRWFGAKVVWDGDYAGARNVFLRIGQGRLHFYEQPPRAAGRNAFHHLGIQVGGLDALYERMRAGGVVLPQAVKRSAQGAYLMVQAPDGVLIEVFEPGPGRRQILGDYYC